MPPPANGDDLLRLIRKSGLIAEAAILDYLESAPGVLDGEPRLIAKRFIRDGMLTSFQAAHLLKGKSRGFILGDKYRVLELVGKGGMGYVYLCEHIRMRRLVAVKMLSPERLSDEGTLARFEREAHAIATLNHENIVRAYDIDRLDGIHCLVMEFVDGRNLFDLVNEHGRLDPPRAANYIAQACFGLHHAFIAGWVHRDIKPANLLLDRQGRIKILDLGLARLFEGGDQSVTEQYDGRKAIQGTVDYLAPEQALSDPRADIRTDIYSLGATFYFLLCGQPPFPKGSLAQKLIAHQMSEPEPIAELVPGLPADIRRVVTKMMQKEPAKRHQDPIEIANELVAYVQDPPPLPGVVEMTSWSPRVSKLVAVSEQTLSASTTSSMMLMDSRRGSGSTVAKSRNNWRAAAAAVLVAGLLGVGGYAALSGGGERPPAPPADPSPPLKPPLAFDQSLPWEAPLAHWVFHPKYTAEATVRDLTGHFPGHRLGSPRFSTGRITAVELNQAGRRDDGFLVRDAVTDETALLPRKAVTLIAWVRVDRLTRRGGIIGVVQDDLNFGQGFMLGYAIGQRPVFTFELATGGRGQLLYQSGKTGVEPGRWYHVAATYDGEVQRLFVNGEPDAQSAASGPIIYDFEPAAPFVIGRYRDYKRDARPAAAARADRDIPMVGALKEILMYDRALTPRLIRMHFAQNRAWAEERKTPGPGAGVE